MIRNRLVLNKANKQCIGRRSRNPQGLRKPASVLNSLGVGKGDQVLFVSLKTGFQPSEELRRELLALTHRKLGPAVVPREIEFQASLPKTRSGKIMQRLLKAREWGFPEGDLSTLENTAEPEKEANGGGKP